MKGIKRKDDFYEEEEDKMKKKAKRNLGIVIFLAGLIGYLTHPIGANDIITGASILALIIGFVLLAGN